MHQVYLSSLRLFVPLFRYMAQRIGSMIKSIGIIETGIKMKTIHIQKTGYGHWLISMEYRKKIIRTTTTDSMAVDDFNSPIDEKQGRKLRWKAGYEQLRAELIMKNA